MLSKTQQLFNDKFTKAKNERGNSCFWNDGDWEDWWELQEKLAIMWFDTQSQESGYRANVKSPEITGRIQATMQKLVKLNLAFEAKAMRPYAKEFRKLVSVLVNHAFSKGKMSYRLADGFYDAIRHGSAFIATDFVVRKRKVKMPITKEEEMTAEEKKDLKEKGKLPYRTINKLDLRDVVVSNRRIQELYFDPDARNIHEEVYYAGYYFDVKVMPFTRFKKVYKGRLGYNVRGVKPVGSHEAEETDWFLPPKDLGGDYVYVVTMWDYDNDRMMVRANDKFIYEGPLPYQHKKLNIVSLSPFKLPEQFYGIGLVDFLIPIIYQLELIQNAVYDYTMYTTNPILMVERSIYPEFARRYREAQPGMMIPAMNVNQAVAPLKYMPLSMDVFQAISSLQRDAVIASQVDPSQLGMVQKNATATANMINREIMDAYVNFIVFNFERGLNEIASQVFSLLMQFLTNKDVYEIVNGGKVEQVGEYRTLAIDDYDIKIDWDEHSISIEDRPGYTSHIELKPELFFYEDEEGAMKPIQPEDFAISLSTQSKEILSEALEAQRMQENLGRLSPFMVDPTDKAKVANHPMPLINANSFMEEYFEKNNIDKKHLIRVDEQVQETINRAMEQNKEMMSGIMSVPQAGEREEHIKVHEEFLKTLKKIQGQMQKQLEAYQMVGQMDQSVVSRVMKLQDAIDTVANHLAVDSQPAYMKTDSIISGTGGQGGNTAMGGVGNMGNPNTPQPQMPNMVQQGGMQGGPGQMGGML